jgi:predicted nucleic acid-binding protein
VSVTIVADTSALLPALVDAGSAGEAARAALNVSDLIAPALIDVELVHALRGRVRGGKLEARIAVQAIADLRRIPMERCDMLPLLDRVWQLRENLTAYDATFVALAEAFDAVLVTGDERLAKSTGPRCGFQVVSPA